jgi:hypothetical protein
VSFADIRGATSEAGYQKPKIGPKSETGWPHPLTSRLPVVGLKPVPPIIEIDALRTELSLCAAYTEI